MLATGLLATAPAQAGGWAETVLDPPPAAIEPEVTYTFGFWVLQHGSYPVMNGDLGEVTLTATDGHGTEVAFPATPSATEAHYSAEVVFPHKGVWQVGATQGMFMPDPLVAVVTVPGEVEITPSEVAQRAPHDWGAVRPSFPPAADDAQFAAPHAPYETTPEALVEPRTESPPEPVARSTSEETGSGWPVELVAAGGLAVLALAVGLGRRYRRRTG